MSEEPFSDGRWPTRNTKLASALLVSRFRLLESEPFTCAKDDTREREGFVTTIWFHPTNPDGIEACDMWQAWEEKSVSAIHLCWMRAALEKRDWLIKCVIHAERKRSEVLAAIPSDRFETANLALATTLAAHNCFLAAYSDRVFYFRTSEKLNEIVKEFGMSDDELAAKKLNEKPCNWMLKVIAQQDILIRLVMEHQRIKQLAVHNERGDVAFFGVNADRELQRAMMRELVRSEARPG